MVDVRRDKADLAARFPNNINKEIDAQDLRDFLESMHKPFAGLSLSVPAATIIGVADTYVKAAGTTIQRTLRKFTHSDNRLTYIGGPSIHTHIALNFTVSAAGANKVIGLKLAKNGIVDDGTYMQREIQSVNDKGAIPIHGDFNLDTNDFIELWLTNETDTANVTIETLYMWVMGMFI